MRLGRRRLLAAAGLPLLAGGRRARADGVAGEMRIAYKDDIATLDPAIGYDQNNWSLIRAMFDGLLGYRPGTTTLVPRLAADWRVDPDGRTHRFVLRQDVRFHNGRKLVADDVVYSIARARDPATACPGTGFYDAIERVDAIGHDRVAIRLARPSAAFGHALALNFAFVVPREEIERTGADFGRHPIGTGPFRLAEWRAGERLVLAANPDYFEPGVPGLSRLVVRIGMEPVTGVLAFERGEIDALGDAIPPSQYASLRRDPTTASEIVTGPRLSTVFLSMRTNRAPFDDLRVRQAVAHAIDRAHLVRLMNGRIVAADGILPPGMPGYDPARRAPAYDPALARRLLAASGHAAPIRASLLVTATDPYPRLAEALQQYLADIGIAVVIDALADSNVAALASDPEGPALVFSGGLAWSADYPDPSDFFTPILSCGAARPDGWNWSYLCRPSFDAAARQADAMLDVTARAAAWRMLFGDIERQQPWVALYHERLDTLVSHRLAGPPSIFADPISAPINFPYVRTA